jgi:murein DD-endopeptidase MepM/ murein hydrolase activator NlpD
MIGISVLLLCCYGLYSSFDVGLLPANKRATVVSEKLPKNEQILAHASTTDPKKILIGNRIKNLCVSFFTSKGQSESSISAAVRNVDTKNNTSYNPQTKFRKNSVPIVSGRSFTDSSYRPFKSGPQILKPSVSFSAKRCEEYLLTKYDVGALQEGNELLKLQSVKLALSKKDSLQYTSSLGQLNSPHLCKNLCSRIRSISGAIMSINERYKVLDREDAVLVGQLRNVSNGDAPLGIKHLTALDEMCSKIPLLIPQGSARVTSHFGKRSHKRRITNHKGIDMTSPEDTIYAAADGKVEFCGWHQGYGNLIVINHGKFVTKYGHLRKICVSKGESVTQGKRIAFEGATGNARGRHLHFEVLSSGQHLDPMEFIVYSMKDEQKAHSDKIFAMQKLQCNRSVILASSAASVKKGKNSVQKVLALGSTKVRARVLLAGDDKQVSQKACARRPASRRVVNSLNKAQISSSKSLIVEEAITATPKKSFFGSIYRAILPW